MAKGFKNGAGGILLNFKVIGNPQPSTARENTIWVDTDKINNYYFSPEQPGNMAEYDVWFPMDTASPVKFDALKKNGIQVFPGSAKQYIGGVLSSKVASIYQNDAWTQFSYNRVYLFKSGEGAIVELKGYKEKNATVSIGVDSIDFNYSDKDEYYIASLRTVEKVSLAAHTKLCMEYTASKRLSSQYAHIGVTSTAFTTGDPTINWVAQTAFSASTALKTVSVDLSTVANELYVAVKFGGTMSIMNIWLE